MTHNQIRLQFSRRQILSLAICVFGVFLAKAFLLVGEIQSSNSSDSTSAPGTWSLKIRSGHIYQSPVDNEASVFLPQYATIRRPENREVRNSWGLAGDGATDNPFYHGATWLEVGTTITPFNSLSADLGIYAEHRGVSYGINSRDALFLAPRYNIRLDTSFHVFDQRIAFGGSIGDRRNDRLHEGLMIENIDVQGMKLYMSWGKLRFQFTKIGDLVNQLGLNIDDLDDFSLHWDNQELWHPDWTIDLTASRTFTNRVTPRSFARDLFDNSASYSASIQRDSTLRFYGQLAHRFSRNDTPQPTELMAFVVGSDLAFSTETLKVNLTGEWRRYGFYFNTGYQDLNIYFREQDGGNYNNTTGENTYPIQSYDYGFSQWAVYTEISPIGTMEAFILRGDAQWFFHDDLYLRAALDLNFLNHERAGTAEYEFQSYMLGWMPRNGNHLEIGFSNRTMNLDKHYPTFYQYAGEFVLELRAKFAVDFFGNLPK